MRKSALFLALLTLCPAGGGTAYAAAPDQVLPKVVVTAGRIEEKATSVTQNVTVIPAEEILKNQHQDIGGLLRQYGLQVDSTSANASFSQIGIRGLRTNLFGDELQSPVLILIDGRRTGTSNISMIPMVNVERIEILRGAGAVQYGASAMGGVVNIITRRGTPDTLGMAEVGAGSFETFRGQGELAGYYKGFDYSMGASFLTAEDYKTGSGRLYENTAIGRKVGYSVNLGYNFLEDQRVGVTALGVDANDMGSPNDIRAIDTTAHTDRYNYSFDMTYDGGLKAYGLDWKARYFVGRSNYESFTPDDPWGSYFYQSRADYQGAQGQLSFSKSFLTLTGGLDWTKHDLWDSSNGDNDYKNTGVFLLGKLSFLEDLIVVSGGVRYDDYKISMGNRDDSLDNTSPSVGLALNPLDWLTLRVNYGESFVIPTAMQFLGYESMWGDYLGNPDLDPEKGKGWDAGFDLHYRSLNLGLTYFQTDYKDKIATRRLSGGDSQYYNLSGKSKLRGIEAQFSLDVGEFMDWPFALRPYLNLTRMLKYEDKDGQDLKSVSKMDLAYGLGFNHPDWGLDVDLRFIYFGEQEIDDYDPVTYASGPDTIGGRTTADLYITQAFYRSETLGTFSVRAEFRNLFDKDYYLTKDFPMPGRSYWLGVRYDY